jgi:seryl-tRNA synthetase
MLDPKFIRENTEIVKTKSAQKNKDPKLVDQWLEIDVEYRDLQQQIEVLNRRKNEIAELLKDSSKRTPELMAEGKELKSQLEPINARFKELETKWYNLIILIPNMHFDDTPVGKNEDENIVIRKHGEPTKFDFTPKDHIELGEALGLIDVETASIVAGSRFNYLMGDLALIEMSLVHWVFSFLSNPEKVAAIASGVDKDLSTRPFVPVIPPVMINPDTYTKMARLDPGQEEERFFMPKDNLYLVGSAEHTLGPLHINQTLDEKQLPIRYVGFSTAFRREAGSYGKDVKGILRVHQFDKIELESFSLPEMSVKEQDLFVAIQEYILQQLELPYQVIQICTGDMGGPDARQIDLETWIPSQNKYRETHTADLMTDYQSRRLNTKVKRANGETQLVHMNDATAIAIGRFIIAIMENYQQADGTIKVPEILVTYVGKEYLGKRP